MALSKWNVLQLTTIDGKATTTNFVNAFNVGLIYAGGVKTGLRRELLTYDIGALPAEGEAISPGATITAAWIEGTATVFGSPGVAHTATRIARTDWVASEATWNVYKTLNNWTTAGAGHDPNDINGTTPAAVGFTGPSTDGAYSITGLREHYLDARDNRSGQLHLRLRMNDETDDGVNRWWALSDTRFVVEYTPPGAGVVLLGGGPGIL